MHILKFNFEICKLQFWPLAGDARAAPGALNVHFHTVAFDGVFSTAGPVPVYHQLRGPTDEEVADIVATLVQDVVASLRERGYLAADGGEVDAATWLDKCFAESLPNRRRNGPRWGGAERQRARTPTPPVPGVRACRPLVSR